MGSELLLRTRGWGGTLGALGAFAAFAAACSLDTRTTSVVDGQPENETASNLPGAQAMGRAGASSTPAPSPGSEGSAGNAPLDGTEAAGGGMTAPAAGAPEPSAEPADNLFSEVLGVTAAEVDEKLTLATDRLFGIGTNEANAPSASAPSTSGFRLYYELPQDPNRAFIWSGTVEGLRAERIAFAMMIAVQMDLRDQFDRLWNFAQAYSQYIFEGAPAAWARYFRYQGEMDMTNPLVWSVDFGLGTTPSPRGDTYFAAALYLADRRWGSADNMNYQREADAISHAMLINQAEGARTPAVDPLTQLVVFAPLAVSATYASSGQQLPAFYQLFAADGPEEDSDRWRRVALASRELLSASANPVTGLHPDYVNFDGTPNTVQASVPLFGYEALHTVLNVSIDSAWFGLDARQPAQVAKYHEFFAADAAGGLIPHTLYPVDGSATVDAPTTGLPAVLAAGALVSTAPNRADFVRILWDLPQPSGAFRAYEEMTYLLALLAAGGRFNLEWPDATP